MNRCPTIQAFNFVWKDNFGIKMSGNCFWKALLRGMKPSDFTDWHLFRCENPTEATFRPYFKSPVTINKLVYQLAKLQLYSTCYVSSDAISRAVHLFPNQTPEEIEKRIIPEAVSRVWIETVSKDVHHKDKVSDRYFGAQLYHMTCTPDLLEQVKKAYHDGSIADEVLTLLADVTGVQFVLYTPQAKTTFCRVGDPPKAVVELRASNTHIDFSSRTEAAQSNTKRASQCCTDLNGVVI